MRRIASANLLIMQPALLCLFSPRNSEIEASVSTVFFLAR